jgi:mannosyltransferase OCH1-like enzyme
MYRFFPDLSGCLWFDTGDGNLLTNTLSIVGKNLFDILNPLYSPEYIGYFCDDEFTQKCIKLGKIIRINNTIIKHSIPDTLNMHHDATYLKSLKYGIRDKAVYKIRQSIQFDIPGIMPLPSDHNLPSTTVAQTKRNTNWNKCWYKSEPWYDDPISTLDLYILEKQDIKISKMDKLEFMDFAANYYRNFRWTIPKIIHQIWLGDRNDQIDEMMDTFAKKYIKQHPTWRYMLWDEEKLKTINMINQDIYDQESAYDCKSEISRLEILNKFGGLYLDSDLLWLETHTLDELISLSSDKGLTLFKEKHGDIVDKGYLRFDTTRCSNGVMGATIANPVIAFLIGQLKTSYEKNRKKGVVAATGPDFIQGICTDLELEVCSHKYVYPIWFCKDKKRNPDYEQFMDYQTKSLKDIASDYPEAILFHKGWDK